MLYNTIKHITCTKLTEGNYVVSGLMAYIVGCTNLSGVRSKGGCGLCGTSCSFCSYSQTIRTLTPTNLHVTLLQTFWSLWLKVRSHCLREVLEVYMSLLFHNNIEVRIKNNTHPFLFKGKQIIFRNMV